MAIRDFVKSISPSWLQDGAGERYLYNAGIASDALLEKLTEAMHAHMPTKADATALPVIGSDRLVPQGLTETSASYATRLQHAFESWQVAGTPWGVLREVLGAVLAAQPMARTVSSSLTTVSTTARWSTYTEAADTSKPPTVTIPGTWNWDWDSATGPGAAAWWRYWLILFAGATLAGTTVSGATNATPIEISTSSPHGLATGATVFVDGVGGNLAANGKWTITVTGASTFTLTGSVGTGAYTSGGVAYAADAQNWIGPAPFVWGTPGVTWGGRSDASWGFNQPPSVFSALRQIIALRQAGHSWCHEIIVPFDSTLFDPAHATGGGINPNGEFGSWAKVVAGQYVAARFTNARYCDGV